MAGPSYGYGAFGLLVGGPVAVGVGQGQVVSDFAIGVSFAPIALLVIWIPWRNSSFGSRDLEITYYQAVSGLIFLASGLLS